MEGQALFSRLIYVQLYMCTDKIGKLTFAMRKLE